VTHSATSSWCSAQRKRVKSKRLGMNIDCGMQTGNYTFMFPPFSPSPIEPDPTLNHMPVVTDVVTHYGEVNGATGTSVNVRSICCYTILEGQNTAFRLLQSMLYVKANLSLCFINQPLSHEDVWGSGCIDPYFLDVVTSWRWVVSFTPRPLYSRGKSIRYPIDRRLGGP
jgi:hypothetical protein